MSYDDCSNLKTFLNRVTIKKQAVHIQGKFYQLQLLGKLVVNMEVELGLMEGHGFELDSFASPRARMRIGC